MSEVSLSHAFDDAPDTPPPPPPLVLTEGQERARQEIMAAMGKANMLKGNEHVLMGFAGTGKSTLMKVVVAELRAAGKRVAVCAPTNKAVAVQERMLREAGVSVECCTIFSLLGLTPGSDDAKRKPKRVGKNRSAGYDVVIIDECSMLGIDIMDWVKIDLARHFVLYIGDPAQLPPVGENLSQTFLVKSRSTLDQIMRQAADNPIIKLSIAIRRMIDTATPDWTAFAVDDDDNVSTSGIYCPSPDESMAWIEGAFTSPEFAANNDMHRYLCWTNARVAYVNAHVRRLIYGETPTPYIPGENIMVRSPIKDATGNVTVIQTNDEAEVVSIKLGTYAHAFDPHAGGTAKSGKVADKLDGWTAGLDVWDIQLRARSGQVVSCRIPADPAAHRAHCDRLVMEANANWTRWHEYFDYQDAVAKIQSVYAMTVHTSQGSSFDNCFVDINDCRRNGKTVELLKLLYVACTRPRKALVLV